MSRFIAYRSQIYTARSGSSIKNREFRLFVVSRAPCSILGKHALGVRHIIFLKLIYCFDNWCRHSAPLSARSRVLFNMIHVVPIRNKHIRPKSGQHTHIADILPFYNIQRLSDPKCRRQNVQKME